MANVFKRIAASDAAIKSISALPIKGVISGGNSAADIAERAGMPVVLNSSGLVDSSLVPEGGGGDGGGGSYVSIAAMAPYADDPTQIGADIESDIGDQISNACEPGGTIDVAIESKGYLNSDEISDMTTVPSDFSDFYTGDKEEIGANIKDAIDAIEAKIGDSSQVGTIRIDPYRQNNNWLECNGAAFNMEIYPELALILTDGKVPLVNLTSIVPSPFKAYIKAR